MYTDIYIVCYIYNKECSISVIEHAYLSSDNIDTESIVLDDSQFLTYVIIGPSLVIV